jgi:hypothetical protein
MNLVSAILGLARSHTSLRIRVAIATVGWNVLAHPPYKYDLAPSNVHLFPIPQKMHSKHAVLQMMR